MPAKSAAKPPNPKTAARIARIRKITTQSNSIVTPFFVKSLIR